MKIEQIHPNYVCQIWPHIGGMLAKALVHSCGEFNIDQLKHALVRGEQVLLVAMDEEQEIHGAACVVFNNYPGDRVAFITAVSGRMVATLEIWEQLKSWCVNNGATKVRGAVREAAARLWRQKFGFEQRYIIVEHAL